MAAIAKSEPTGVRDREAGAGIYFGRRVTGWIRQSCLAAGVADGSRVGELLLIKKVKR